MSSTQTVSEHRSSTVRTFNNRLTAVKYLLNTNAHHTKLKLSTCGGFFLKNPPPRAAKYATFLTDHKEVIYAIFRPILINTDNCQKDVIFFYTLFYMLYFIPKIELYD